MLIYKIVSLIDGRSYIGQTVLSLKLRMTAYRRDVGTFKKGKYKARSKIIAAIAKYGINNFNWFVIDTAKSQSELDLKERFWISIYNSTVQGIGFNIQLGGFGHGKHSLETRKRISESNMGRIPYNKGKPGLLSGENVGTSVLTQKQANQIREEYKVISSSVKLAKKFNVSKACILNILRNKTYIDPLFISITSLPKPWFVYIIQSLKDESLYTGATIDIENRLMVHNEGRGGNYTRSRPPFILIKSFKVANKSEALKLEYRIKQLSREEKFNFQL
jgi:putative endonuclease